MDRRKFLVTGALGAAAGSLAARQVALASRRCSKLYPASDSTLAERQRHPAPAILQSYSVEDHRRRLTNIALCHRGIRACLKQHLITSYLPGQCTYNLGEYPCRKPWNPDDWDEQELDKLHQQGIRLIQVHEEWTDILRVFGGSRTTPLNPAGFRRFVDMVHRRGMKLIIYVSSGRFQRPDPDFRPEWAGPPSQDLVELGWHKAHCSMASPGWRAYILPRLMRIMDDYGVDGFYNDLGYLPLAGRRPRPDADEVFAFEESEKCDGALTDLLALIYAEVNRRGGIVKVHYGGAARPKTDLKVYDYLWVGEAVQSGDNLREATKDFPPYLVPCLDMSRARIKDENELYLHAVPYMQFPLLLAGRPFTGERGMIPGIKYQPEEKCFWTRHCREIWKRFQEHPEGPHSYGWWDSVPGRPEARPTHAHWLKQYLPLTEEGTWAWLDVGDCDLLRRPPDKNVVVSAFANRRLHLVLANYERAAVEVETVDAYLSSADPKAAPKKRWELPGRSLHILRRVEPAVS